MATSLNDILSQVKQLDKEEQLMLLQRIAYLIKRTDTEQTASTRLTSLSGLGSQIWKSTVDIDNYIDGERGW